MARDGSAPDDRCLSLTIYSDHGGRLQSYIDCECEGAQGNDAKYHCEGHRPIRVRAQHPVMFVVAGITELVRSDFGIGVLLHLTSRLKQTACRTECRSRDRGHRLPYVSFYDSSR